MPRGQRPGCGEESAFRSGWLKRASRIVYGKESRWPNDYGCERAQSEKATCGITWWPFDKPGIRKSDLIRADGGLDFRFVDVEVGVNVLHIVMLFEGFHQAQHLRGLRAGKLDVILRNHADFRRRRSDTRFGERFLHSLEGFGWGHDVPCGAVVLHIFRASFQNQVE